MENTQLSSKNNLFTRNIYQNNDTWINILDETEFVNKVLKMVVFQLICPTLVHDTRSYFENNLIHYCDLKTLNKSMQTVLTLLLLLLLWKPSSPYGRNIQNIISKKKNKRKKSIRQLFVELKNYYIFYLVHSQQNSPSLVSKNSQDTHGKYA